VFDEQAPFFGASDDHARAIDERNLDRDGANRDGRSVADKATTREPQIGLIFSERG
jgi:hypothetical protein